MTKQDSVENLINQAEILLKSKLYCFINNAGKMIECDDVATHVMNRCDGGEGGMETMYGH